MPDALTPTPGATPVPPQGGDNFAALLKQINAQDTETKTLLSDETREMKAPMEAAGSVLSSPRPAQPQLQAAPKSPDLQKEQGQSAKNFAVAAVLVSGLMGAVSRQHVTTALTAFGSAIKGLKEGQTQAATQAHSEWKDAADEVTANNDSMIKEYQAAMSDRKASLDEQMARIQMIATKYHDPITAQAAGAKNYLLLGQLQERMKEAQDKWIEAQNKLDQQWKEFKDKQKQQLATQDMVLNEDGSITPTPLDPSVGGQVATGQPLTQVIPGYGAAVAKRRERAREAGIQQIMNENPGMSPQQAGAEMSNRANMYLASRRSEGQLMTQLGATRAALPQVEFNLAQAKKAMDQLGPTSALPVLNAIARGEERWTGDPAYSSLFFYMTAATTETARIMSGGVGSVAQLHEGAREEAKKWMDVNWTTPGQFDRLRADITAEAQNRVQNYTDAIAAQKVNAAQPAPGGAAAPAAAPAAKVPAAGTIEDGFRFKGGDPSKPDSWERVQ